MQNLTISKLAKMSGVGVETIRFYQRKDLLREPKANGTIRIYTIEDSQRIVFIKRAQNLGFTLSEIKELLDLNTKSRVTCSSVKLKTDEKLKEIEEKIKDLLRIKKSLISLSLACDGDQDKIKQYKVQDCFEKGFKSCF